MKVGRVSNKLYTEFISPIGAAFRLFIFCALLVHNVYAALPPGYHPFGANAPTIGHRLNSAKDAFGHAMHLGGSLKDAIVPNVDFKKMIPVAKRVAKAAAGGVKTFVEGLTERDASDASIFTSVFPTFEGSTDALFDSNQDPYATPAYSQQDNWEQLERTVGKGAFYKPFLQSLTPEAKQLLKNQTDTNYVRMYNGISQRLFMLLRGNFRTVVNYQDSKAESTNLFDFEEEPEVKPGTSTEVKKLAVGESLLQVESTSAPVAPHSALGQQKAPLQRVQRQQQQQRKDAADQKLLPWEQNPRLVQMMLAKIVELLGGNSKVTDARKRLEDLAAALGYAIVMKRAPVNKTENAPSPSILGADIFWACGENPFLLGHLATAMLAYVDYEAYFSGSPSRPFYTFYELVSTRGGQKFDDMCGIKRGSKYKRGTNGAITTKTRRERRDNPALSSNARFLCDLLEVLLEGVNLYLDKAGALLREHGVAYESNAGSLVNGRRMQAVLCSDPRDAAVVVRCNFKSSLLNKPDVYAGLSDVEAHVLKAKLRDAFDLFKIMSDANLETEELPQTWLKMLWDPRRYAGVFETILSYDQRMFHKGKKRSWFEHYQKFEQAAANRNLREQNQHAQSHPQDLGQHQYGAAPDKRMVPLPEDAYYRLYRYMDTIGAKAWVNGNFSTLEHLYGLPPSVLFGGALFEKVKTMYARGSNGLVHIFLYYLLTMKHPGAGFSKCLRAYSKGDFLSNIVESSKLFKPRALKRGIKWLLQGGVNQTYRRHQAQVTLLQVIPIELIKKALTSITFVTHSLALFQLNQNAERWGKGLMTGNEREEKHFVRGGYVNYIDNVIKTWSYDGYSKSISEKLRQGIQLDEEDLKQANFHSIRHAESLKWDKYLNGEIVKGLDTFLDLASIKILDPKSSLLYAIVQDSRDNLEKNLEDTIFFGRIVQAAPYNNKLWRLFKRVVSLGKLLLTSVDRNVEHAVWFGVKFDYEKILSVVEDLHVLGKKLPNNQMYNLEESFTDLLESLIGVISNAEFRDPPGVVENYGMPSISPLYPKMQSEERQREFQQSMCQHHCAAIWKALLGFTMSSLRSPASIAAFESMLSKDKSLNDMNKPEFVNNLRFALKGDAMLHLYDNMVPKKMKRELKSIKFGRGFYFANLVKLSSKLLERLGFKYTSNLFRVQAPYFGHFINDWAAARATGKKKAVFAALGLGTLATYSVLQCAEIAQHATDVGLGPIEECWYLLKPPRQFCTVLPISHVAKNAVQIGVHDALSATVLAVIGPYLFLPMGIVSAWAILKHQFKIIHRLDIAATQAFKRMWRKITSGKAAQRLANWLKNSRKYRNRIEAEGLIASQNASKNARNVPGGSLFTVSDELLPNDDVFSYTSFS